MDKLKIVVGTNSLTSAKHQAYSNHCQLWFRFGRNYPHEFVFSNPDRMSIDRMRNMTAEVALQVDADYLLFLDDDVLAPPNFLDKFLAADVDVIAGDVMIRGYPFNHMLFKYTDESQRHLEQLKDVPEELGVIDVDAVGFSLCLIKVSLLRKLSKPYFITGISNTEDIYFCLKARKEFPETTIKADTSVQCAHILWDETISPMNKKFYKEYYAAQYPEACAEIDKDRGMRYLNLIHEKVVVPNAS